MSDFISLLTGEARKSLPDPRVLPQQSIVKVDLFDSPPKQEKAEPAGEAEEILCTKCGEWQPKNEFYLMKRHNGIARMSECRTCRKIAVAAYQKRNADQIRMQRAKRRAAKKRAAEE